MKTYCNSIYFYIFKDLFLWKWIFFWIKIVSTYFFGYPNYLFVIFYNIFHNNYYILYNYSWKRTRGTLTLFLRYKLTTLVLILCSLFANAYIVKEELIGKFWKIKYLKKKKILAICTLIPARKTAFLSTIVDIFIIRI